MKFNYGHLEFDTDSDQHVASLDWTYSLYNTGQPKTDIQYKYDFYITAKNRFYFVRGKRRQEKEGIWPFRSSYWTDPEFEIVATNDETEFIKSMNLIEKTHLNEVKILKSQRG